MTGNHELFPPFPSVQQMQHPNAASREENISIGILQYGFPLQAPVQSKPVPLLAGKFLSSSHFHETIRLSSSPLLSPFSSYLPQAVALSSSQLLALPPHPHLHTPAGPQSLRNSLESHQGIPQMHPGQHRNAKDIPGKKGSGIKPFGQSCTPDLLLQN